jgi:hypothetical protein
LLILRRLFGIGRKIASLCEKIKRSLQHALRNSVVTEKATLFRNQYLERNNNESADSV